MGQSEIVLDGRAEQLRQDFDRTFSVAPPQNADVRQSFLAIAVGDVGWALRMTDVAGIHRHPKITSLPGGPIDLVGLANVRGTVIPVYDLRLLLNAGRSDVAPKWLVVTAPPLRVGLAFDRFDGYVQRDDDRESQMLRVADQLRSIVDLQPILESIKNRTHAGASQGE